MGVDPKTVDISPNPPYSDMDEYEARLSRRFAYFVRNARNIRLITDSSQKLKKKKDWGLDPEFVAYNVAFNKWPSELPPDLQVPLPADGSPPQLPSHFVGNMHTQYQLGVVMLHRPQLVASKSFANDIAWRKEMLLCYTSAKTLCRLQEAVLQQYGSTGLLCMVRGINFTVYTILTCTMIHLVHTLPVTLVNVKQTDTLIDCLDIPRSRVQLGCSRLFHTTHEGIGAMSFLVHARDTGTDQRLTQRLFGRHQPAV